MNRTLHLNTITSTLWVKRRKDLLLSLNKMKMKKKMILWISTKSINYGLLSGNSTFTMRMRSTNTSLRSWWSTVLDLTGTCRSISLIYTTPMWKKRERIFCRDLRHMPLSKQKRWGRRLGTNKLNLLMRYSWVSKKYRQLIWNFSSK